MIDVRILLSEIINGLLGKEYRVKSYMNIVLLF